jgi:predicted ATP-dependent endonuclease of OLD family
MKIKKLTLKQFTVFEQAEFEFCDGINILIGENGTGKSHLLKIMYSLMKASEEADTEREKKMQNAIPEEWMGQKISHVFRPVGEGFQRLISRQMGGATASVDLVTDIGETNVRLTSQGKLYLDINSIKPNQRSIFIPSREVLSICSSLRSAYESVNLNFDETYYDLAKELLRPTLRGPRGEKAGKMIKPLEAIINGTVYDENGVFYVKQGGTQSAIEAHLLAEGWRKIASLCRLILNGSLFKNSVLFWDEPEANLNPQLIKPVCDILRRLAQMGVQIFVTTHDYLLTNELSLVAEYPDKPSKPQPCLVRFIGLTRDAEHGTSKQVGETLPEIRENPILAAYAKHYDEEEELLDKSADVNAGTLAK